MDDVSDVGLVYAHPESNGGHHHFHLIHQKFTVHHLIRVRL
jgi:hypothetical protein